MIRDAGRLAGIPGVLIHGRLDLSCPATTAWELARAWPGAELLVDDHSGHRGSDIKRTWMLETLAKFADSDNAKIVIPFESAGLLGAAQTLRSVLAATPENGDHPA